MSRLNHGLVPIAKISLEPPHQCLLPCKELMGHAF
ncbi:uncharacterized protein DNG_09992 [Cephalotrichum gorgonifer]|uniref:Uncharacterized protein n=1 Tax=Cephalotrichum gorgonifer TaxID=2041049 RepID=A0AAE8N8F9_9PEZI|nr:uncharacterized protein DNG_09992 [Cephalotrichum gorgonifer]